MVLARRDDPALVGKVKDLLDKLAADPASGVARVMSRPEIASAGANPHADLFLDARAGYYFDGKLRGPW